MDPSAMIRAALAPITAALLISACASAPPAAKRVEPQTSPTPIPPQAVRIEKPVNVSFSTYSREWPVGWQWVDPDEGTLPTPHDVKGGVLRLKVPTGKGLTGTKRNSPRYVKPITGDFQIETRIRSAPKENYQGAGLLIFLNDENFVRFDRAFGGVGGGGEGLRIDVMKRGELVAAATPETLQTDSPETDLKIIRQGDAIMCFWRLDEEAEWREAGSVEIGLGETVLAGVSASNTARDFSAEFVYIKLLPAPKADQSWEPPASPKRN